MASYEQQPQYQTYQFQPYQLPYNQLVKTVQAKTEYWLQGANQLKTAYQNAVGMDLSLDSNRQALKGFTDQINDSVNNAAKGDLSIGDNVTQALHLFDPIYNGETEASQNILGDHSLTTRAKQIQAQFQEAKTKNNGKEYSPVNEQYALQSYYDFVRNGDAKGWKQAYQNLKGYTPYYDYHKEITDNLKNCRPSSVSQTGINGMYITTQSASGLTSSQVAGCVGSNLSSQAESQMMMEGVVKYGHNYQALADDYIGTAQQGRQYLSNQRAQLAAQLAGKLTPQQAQGIQSQLKDYDAQISNLDESIDRYHRGDLSFFKNNYDQLAAATYRGQKLQAIGNAFQYREESNSIKADPVKMMISNQRHQDAMLAQRERFESQKDQFDWDRKMQLEAMKLGKRAVKGPNGYSFVDPDLAQNPDAEFPAAGPDDVVKTGAVQFNNDLTSNLQAQTDNQKWLYSYLKSNPKWADLVPDINKDRAAFNAFAEGMFKNIDPNNMDAMLQSYLTKKQKLSWDYAHLKATQQAVETSPVAKVARGDLNNFLTGITTGESAILRDVDGSSHLPINLSAQDMRDLVSQGRTSSGISLSKTSIAVPTPNGGTIAQGNALLIGNKKYDIPPRLQQLLIARDKATNQYQATLDNLYNNQYASQHAWVSLDSENDDLKSPNALRRKIGDALAPLIGHGDNSVDAVKDVILQATDFGGNVRFSVKPNNKGELPDDKKVIQQLAARGIPNVKSVPNTTGMYEVSGIGTMGGINYNRPEVSAIRQVQSFAENLVRIHQQGGDSSPRVEMPSYNGINLAAVKGPSGELYFELSDPNHPGIVQHATSAAELVYDLNRITNQ